MAGALSLAADVVETIAAGIMGPTCEAGKRAWYTEGAGSAAAGFTSGAGWVGTVHCVSPPAV